MYTMVVDISTFIFIFFLFYFYSIFDFLLNFNSLVVNSTITIDNFFFYQNRLSSNSFLIACFISVFIFLILVLNKPVTVLKSITMHINFIVFVSVLFIFADSFILLFICFELLLLVSISLLKLTSKSERVLEAVNEMFLWTLFGSFFILIAFFLFFNFFTINYNFLYTNSSISLVVGSFFVIGFGVKIPVWPCFSWLLKAHVEASVEFSILLSGFIVKLGILGLLKVFDYFYNQTLFNILFFLVLMGIIDAVLRLFAQQDLKKIVALTTIIETNWLFLCFLLGDSISCFIGNSLVVIHCFTTASEFLIVECISKRYNTRDIFFIGSIWNNTPNLWYLSLLVVLVTIGFPGTSIFILKFMFLSNMINYSILITFFYIFIFFFFLPIFFIRLWLPLWFGLFSRKLFFFDLFSKEVILLSFLIIINIVFGLYPNFINLLI